MYAVKPVIWKPRQITMFDVWTALKVICGLLGYSGMKYFYAEVWFIVSLSHEGNSNPEDRMSTFIP
jgi:hypothetical protein